MRRFIRVERGAEVFNGHPTYDVVNQRSGSAIAQVFFYQPWRQWTVRFNEDSVWSDGCLAEVREFLGTLV